MSFTVKANMKCFDIGENVSGGTNVDIDITMDSNIAEYFLFKFSPYVFEMGQFKVLIKHDGYNKLEAISMQDDKTIYIVRNKEQFLADVLEGYLDLKLLEKMNSTINTQAINLVSEDEEEVLDEFDDDIDMGDIG